MAKNNKKLSIEDFLTDAEVLANVKRLKDKMSSSGGLQVSDVLDANQHQYVNLVQKGGGVLGVALVGYTYILEMAGIRFLRLAGTSAGAINTALMTVIGKKEEEKSTRILKLLCEMDFFSFVDGHPFARWLIKNFVSDKSFETQLKSFFKCLAIVFFGLAGIAIAFLGLRHLYTWASPAAQAAIILDSLTLLLIILIAAYCGYLYGRLKGCGYGINPGVTFYEWVKARMEENGVTRVSELEAKATQKPSLTLRDGVPGKTEDLFGDVTFITSELVTENKIQLPLMADLFRVDTDVDLHPARFVRASMAIPVFFESHIITDIPREQQKIKAAWFDHLKIKPDAIPETVRFVDGGMLSNFPINLFYNPRVEVPRMPVFGIDLDDSPPKADTGKNSPAWALGTYVGRLFNTIRYYYDKDFIEKNYVYQRGIGSIKLFGINWLNFFLTDEQKLDMFRRGVKTAVDFLLTFDWKEYKHARYEMQKGINDRNK